MADRQRGAQIALPEPADAGRLVVRGISSFARNHKVISGSYLLGILTLLLVGSGTKLSYQQSRDYNDIMNTIDLQAEYDASQDYWHARNAYQATKGWFFSCDHLCQRNKRRMEDMERVLNDVRREGQARMSDAKSIAGVFSEVGVDEMKDSFWSYFSAGKQFAKRQSMWDLMFMGMRSMMSRRARDESTMEYVIKILMNVLINFSIGLIMSLVFFIIGLWTIIKSYQPNPIVAVVAFVCASCAAFSFVATYLAAMYGAAAGGLYGLAKVAETQSRQGRINDGRRQREQYMHNRPHYQ